MDILEQIVQHKKAELEETMKLVPLELLREKMPGMKPVRDFRSAVCRDSMQIIAEVKKASPSRGIFCHDFRPVQLAEIYEQNGAAAISVLTETEYFKGKLGYLGEIREKVKIPLLRKDFIVEPYQVYEARTSGADAILLITAILSSRQLGKLLDLSRELGLDCLVEAHDENEVKKALAAGSGIIGINNRNLKTFVTDIEVTCRLRDLIPQDIAVVSESGIHGKAEIDKLKQHHINAILIGEALVTAEDTAEKLREMRKLLE